jgi:hypothetical protein
MQDMSHSGQPKPTTSELKENARERAGFELVTGKTEPLVKARWRATGPSEPPSPGRPAIFWS